MAENGKTPTGLGGGAQMDDGVKENSLTPMIPQSEQSVKENEGTFGDSDLEFLKNLLNHADEMDHDMLIETVFSPENLDRLNRLESSTPGAYLIIRTACQTQKISVGKLESAMAGRKKSVEHAQASAAAARRRQQFYAVPGGIDLPLPVGCAIPTGYSVGAGKTAKMDPEEGTVIVAPAGLAILERYRDIESGLTQVQIGAWYDGAKQWHTTTVPRQTISSSHQIISLADFDFPVSSLNARNVVEYFVQFETKNRLAIPEQQTTGHLGWQVVHHQPLGFLAGPETFIPLGSAETVRFLPANPGDGQVTVGFTSAGDLNAWVRDVAQPILQYPKATVGLLASFAVPMLKVLHHPNFVVDYAGLTSQGKTTAQRAAGSVWGNVDEAQPEANVLQSWNATQVGASEMGRILSGLPLILDDSKTARNEKSVAEILYLITNGIGRAKGAKDGGMRAAPTTKTILISSGEKPLTEFTKDGGIKTRVLVVGGSPFGAVTDVSRQVVQAITNAAVDHYGVAGPAWMQWVLDHLSSEWKAWTQTYRAKKAQYTTAANTAGEGRLLAHRAFLETVATLVGTAVPDLQPAIATQMKSQAWDGLWAEMTASAGDPLDGQAALAQLGSWMQAHIELFEGQRRPESFAPTEWLGKWDSNIVAIFHHVVEARLSEWGYDPKAIIAQWRAEGWLIGGEGRHADPKVTIAGQRGRNVYALSLTGLQVAMANTDEAEKVPAEEVNESDPTLTESEMEAAMAAMPF
jgi:hypothetical protein